VTQPQGRHVILNTLFNTGEFIKGNFKTGNWRITFEHKGTKYTWEMISESIGESQTKPGIIKKENLWKHKGKKLVPLIERNVGKFVFDSAELHGKLSESESAIRLFKDDPKIKPVYDAFSSIKRRSFSIDALNKVGEIIPSLNMKEILAKNISEKQALNQIFEMDLGINAKMNLLRIYSYTTFTKIIRTYRQFFPFIKNVRIADFSSLHYDLKFPGRAPIVMMQEVGRNDWIPFLELSSGMQKVFLIIMDIILMPAGGVYLIDEYENSLGVSAIDFFPEFVLEVEKDAQFFITSHHPYLINKIPIKNWYVFHREGLEISIRFGKELIDKYGISKQQSFLKLINDPFYTRK